MNNKNRAILKRVLSYLKPYYKQYTIAIIILVVTTYIGFLQPKIIQTITDDGMMGHNKGVLLQSVGILALLIVINQLMELLQTKIFINIHNRSYFAIFHQVFKKLMGLEKSFYEDKGNAEILSCIQVDVSQVASITDRYTVMCISHAFRIISGIIGLVVINWKLTLIVLTIVPIKAILVNLFSKQREKSVCELLECNRDFSQWFEDSLAGIDEIKLWNLFENRDKMFQEKQMKLLKLEKRNSMTDAWNSLTEVLLEWGIIIILYLIGGVMVCKNDLTIGTVFAFTTYSWYITGPVATLLNLKMHFAQIIPSARRLFSLLDMESEMNFGTKHIVRYPPRIEFRNVSFSYENTRKILDGASFSVSPGEKIAIIGQNGSGKSTILNLLLRFYKENFGEILIDNEPVSQIPLEEYRALFSVVNQAPYLFFGDISNNINLSKKASHDKIDYAMQVSGVADYVERLPQGERTMIGRNGARLSGGEKQKLAVARALVKDAPIIIFDEPASGFDVESRTYLHEMIVNQMIDKSIILITHNYEDLVGLDKIYHLRDGILYQTNQDDLLKFT